MDAEEDVDQGNKEIDEAEVQVTAPGEKPEGIGFLQAVLIPGVIPVS